MTIDSIDSISPISPITDYQTYQRDCQLRWNILNPERYIGNNGVVLDIGCAQGWFVEKSLKCGAKKAIGIDIANYGWSGDCSGDCSRDCSGNNNIVTSAELYDIGPDVNIIFLMSVSIDISIVDKIFNARNVETIFFEPYLDSENKSNWKEDEWLDRFRQIGFEFYQVGISDRDRSLYLLRRHGVHMEINGNGDKIAVKTTVESNEMDFYKKFGNGDKGNEYVLPYRFDNGKIILPWAESTLRLSGDAKSYLKDIKKVIDRIHYLEIIHGDLRISNIVIYNDKPYLIDFSWWRYGNIDEDNGVGSLRGKRGYKYIENAILIGRLRYME